MYTIYILYSFQYKKLYTGYTSNLLQRFNSHNIFSNTDWTRNYRPWIVIHAEYFELKSDALKREKELKPGKGRDWIKKNFDDWIKVFC